MKKLFKNKIDPISSPKNYSRLLLGEDFDSETETNSALLRLVDKRVRKIIKSEKLSNKDFFEN